MDKAITITEMIIGVLTLFAGIGVPVTIGLFNVMKSINQTNTRLDHIESNQENSKNGVSKIPAIESRLRSLEQTRQNDLPQQTRIVRMLASMDTKLSNSTERLIMFEQKFDRKFDQYDKDRVEFYEKYSHILNNKK